MKRDLILVTPAVGFAAEISAGPAPLDFDPGFAGDGTLIIDARPRDLAYAGLIEPSGEIVLFGHSGVDNASFDEAVLQRINSDGTPGTRARFGAQGFGCSAPRAFPAGIRLSNGDYLGGGYVNVQRHGGRLLRRFRFLRHSDFDRPGVRRADPDRRPHPRFGKPARCSSSVAERVGDLDSGFGNSGIATLDLGNTDAAITDIHYDAGRIYVTGWSRPEGGDLVELDAAVAVLRANGSPSPFFNGGASRVFVFDPALGPQADLPQSIDVSVDEKQIVVTGYTNNAERTIQRFGIARFIGRENTRFADGFEGVGR